MKTQVIQVLLRNGMSVRELNQQIENGRFTAECRNDAELLEIELIGYTRVRAHEVVLRLGVGVGLGRRLRLRACRRGHGSRGPRVRRPGGDRGRRGLQDRLRRRRQAGEVGPLDAEWTADAVDNPYRALLGSADGFIVTADSVSMTGANLNRPLLASLGMMSSLSSIFTASAMV